MGIANHQSDFYHSGDVWPFRMRLQIINCCQGMKPSNGRSNVPIGFLVPYGTQTCKIHIFLMIFLLEPPFIWNFPLPCLMTRIVNHHQNCSRNRLVSPSENRLPLNSAVNKSSFSHAIATSVGSGTILADTPNSYGWLIISYQMSLNSINDIPIKAAGQGTYLAIIYQ